MQPYNHTEKNLKIRLSKKFSLYGKFHGSFQKPLFIVVHGLLGNMDEEFYYSATRWFARKGLSTFRFNLYGHQKDARQLMECTLKTHANDLDAVVRYFRERGVKKIFVAGHSFGGLTILSSKEQGFNSAALWDPSYKISFTKARYGLPAGRRIKGVRGYLMHWGINVVIGKAMAEEIDSLSWDTIGKNFKAPTKIILAGNGMLRAAKKYVDNVGSRKSLLIIKGATHYFDDQKGMQERVFASSAEWFARA